MAADDFFSRWSRGKAAQTTDAALPAASNSTVPAAPSADAAAGDLPPALPTMEDVDQLTKESDYSPFVADGVDETVKRSAMKKLFADPHFNIMDGLDIYIGDYSQPDPIPAAMLAALNHGKALLDPLSQLRQPIMNLVEKVLPVEPDTAPDDELAMTEQPLLEEAQQDGGTTAPLSADAATPDPAPAIPATEANLTIETAPSSEHAASHEASAKTETAAGTVPQPLISNPVRS